MGIHSAHIFLRAYAMNALPEVLGEIWTEHAPEPSRQLVALFPEPLPEPREPAEPQPKRPEPWTTLLEARNEFSASMTQKLCRAIKGEAVFARVASGTFSFHLERFIDGRRVEKLELPAPAKDGLGMPQPVDAELVGWEAMGQRGIPAELRYLRLQYLEILPLNGSSEARMGLCLAPGENPQALVSYFRYRIPDPPEESAGPPPIFNLFDGKDMLVDAYAVAGETDSQQLEELLAVLDAIARRKRVSPKFRYVAALEFVTGDEGARKARKQLLRERYQQLLAERSWAFELR